MEFMLWSAIFWGLIVGIYELFAIHADESFVGARWMTHGIQAAIFASVFVFIVMNIEWALSFFPIISDINFISWWNFLPLRIFVGIIAMIKIQASSMIVKGGKLASRGVGEHFIHTLVAGILIILSPEIAGFIWPFIVNLIPFL